MRTGEVNHREYHFVTEDEFDLLIETGELLEWAQFANGYRYGTPKPPDDGDWLVENNFDLSVANYSEGQGAVAIKRNFPDATLVLILPPGRNQVTRLFVLAFRLAGRGSERPLEILRRLNMGRREMRSAPPFYDHVVVNRDAGRAACAIHQILTTAA